VPRRGLSAAQADASKAARNAPGIAGGRLKEPGSALAQYFSARYPDADSVPGKQAWTKPGLDSGFHTCVIPPAARPHLPEEQTMDTTKSEATLREVAGDVQQAAGELLDDVGAQVSGTAKVLSGKAQRLYADFADVMRESTVARPLAALAIAAGVGFILGALHAATRSRPDNVRGD
jgi:uncharacterized protein YjbJ (UPF0337 family)